jgi:ribosomal protein S18 acetylase RimI-like enzyme
MGRDAPCGCRPTRIDVFHTMEAATREPIEAHTDDRGARYGEMWDWMSAKVPNERIWFLDMVGVDPSVQRGGYGPRLVDIGIQGSSRDGVPAFLETSSEDNVRFYERRGFAVSSDGDVPAGGPHVWFMHRRP